MGIGSRFPARAMPMVSPFLGTAFCSGFPGACRCRPPGSPPEPSLGMACPFLEQQKTPGCFYRVSMSSASSWVVLHRLPCRLHFLKKAVFSPFKDKKSVLQSTSIVKRSTPSNMYRILFTVFKRIAGTQAPLSPAASPQCQRCAART